MKSLAALLALHVLLCWPFPWEAGSFAAHWLRPNPDLLVILGVAVAARLARGARPHLVPAVTAALLFMPVYRFGYSLMQVYFGKELEPWHDVLMLPGFEHLMTHDLTPVALAARVAGVVLGLVIVWLVASWSVRAVLRAAAAPRWAGGFLLVCQAVFAAGCLEASVTGQPVGTMLRPSMLRAMVRAACDFVTRGAWRQAELFAERAAAAAAELAATPRDLGELRDTDVYIVFVESYGRCVWRGRTGQELARRLQDLSAKLARRGYATASGFATPSIRGGLSSLAHAELLCAVPVDNRRAFELLLKSEVKALPGLFAEHGYHTVNVQPAMPQPWPDSKRFFGFEQDVFHADLPYEGRPYHWAKAAPDQFALDHVLRRVVWPATKPIFLQYVSVTSHAPFSMVPPYYEDWTRVADPTAFAGEPARTYDIGWANYAGHPQAEAAFLDCIVYSLQCAVGFAAELRRPSLLFVLGDHQPPLAGLATADPTRDVPVHVLSQRADLVQRFLDRGLVAGLVPADDAVALPFARFRTVFLRAVSRR